MTRSSSMKVNETLTAFAVQLPAELDIKPEWVIALPKGYTIEVYKNKLPETPLEERAVYFPFTSVVRNNSGSPDRYGTHNHQHALALRVYIDEQVYALTPKKRTTVESED